MLRRRRDEVEKHWRYLLVNREIEDRNLIQFGPERIFERLGITRAQLDGGLSGGGIDLLATIMKDVTHARHDGAGAVMKELSDGLSAIMGVGRGAPGGSPPPLLGGQMSAYAEDNRRMPIQVGKTAYVHVNGEGHRELFSQVRRARGFLHEAMEYSYQLYLTRADCVVSACLQEVNETIARAQADLLSVAATSSGGDLGALDAGGSVSIPDVTLPNGKVLRFEVRFGNAAISGKMPKPPHTGIVQVNVDDQNTRIVERYVDIAAATAAAQELYGGISRSSMQ